MSEATHSRVSDTVQQMGDKIEASTKERDSWKELILIENSHVKRKIRLMCILDIKNHKDFTIKNIHNRNMDPRKI